MSPLDPRALRPVDPRALRDAFGKFPTGVTVVTARTADGIPVGFTANSFTSVSLDPPLLLVCPAKGLSSIAVFESCERFAVNVLADDQQAVSNTFARPGDDRFAQVAWHPDDGGCPVFDAVAAWFSCAVHQRVDAGDHILLIGRIEAFETADRLGLGYADGGYFSRTLEHAAQAAAGGARRVFAGAIVEWGDRVLVSRTEAGLALPGVTVERGASRLDALHRWFAESGADVTLGPVYSIFDDAQAGASRTLYRATAAGDAAPPGTEYAALEDVLAGTITSRAERSALERFALERTEGRFGLYVGDETAGDVHTQ